MKKTLLKTSLREIKSTPGRFFALMTIILLGVAFFVGISATGPDMKQAATDYYTRTDLADWFIYAPSGLDESTVQTINEESDVAKVQTQDRVDVTQKDQQAVIRLFSYDEDPILNKLTVVKGQLPQAKDEIVIDANVQGVTGYQLGDTLTFEQSKELKQKNYKIVGYVLSPEFLAKDNRGTTTLKNGSLTYFAYTLPENFTADTPNRLALTFNPHTTKKEKAAVKQTIETAYKNALMKQAQALPEDARQTFLSQPIFITTRTDLPGYEEYDQNADRIASLATVFPVIFFFVAALISLTSVSRMVEEKRLEIGTYFALGYRPLEIASKFLLYVTLACVSGIVVGLSIGFYLFPRIIIEAYGQVYDIIGYQTPWQINLVLLATGVSLLCTVVVAFFVVRVELTKVPAVLMRPKAPKAGKKILLERITFLWRRLSFTYKVMFRNLFRYKTRMWMTILGIAGCTAMILTGFGLKDSISEMIPLQFDKLWRYEAVVTLSQENPSTMKTLEQTKEVKQVLPIFMEEVTTTSTDASKQSVSVIVPETNGALPNFYRLISPDQKNKLTLTDQGAIITQKLAKLFSLKKGDTFTVKQTDDQEFTVTIARITENYVGHALYMTNKYYQEVTKETPVYTTALMTFNSPLTTTLQDQLADEWKTNSDVINVSYLSKTKAELESSLGVLTIVMWVLIISAGLLAFIVLYSLNTMSVAERLRELSTIKVLGFFDREVTFYIVRENIILATVGMALGSGLGMMLHRYVIQTVEMDTTMFSPTINPMSYVYAIGLTYLFVAIVGVATHRALKKINMLDALKANE